MLSLLLKFKSLLAIGAICSVLMAISYGWYWHSQYNKSQAIIVQQSREIATCAANQQLLESGVQRWKAAANQYEHRLKRKEALVAKRNAESQKRIKKIMQTKFSKDCNTAIKQGIQHSHKLGFNWHNDIP